jgi:processive rubber oxygenase RoxA-like protein
VWDIWKFDWVQWNGSVAQPMARNVGEALGVKARLELVDDRGKLLPPDRLYDSSVLVRELNCIETTLWKLRPPPWDESVLPKVDAEKATAGRALFEKHCRGCHGPDEVAEKDKSTPEKPVEWHMHVIATTRIGTDPTVVDNFLDYRYDARALDPGNPALESIDGGAGLSLVTEQVIKRKYKELGLSPAEQREYDGFGRSIEVRGGQRGYKARPLQGIWATPPFLHNGSVPNVYELLLPEEQRSKRFWVGSREYDPVRLGYRTDETPGAFLFDTTITGNANTGHQFRDDGGPGVIGPALSDEERWAIIEYLKVMGNPGNPVFDDLDRALPRCGSTDDRKCLAAPTCPAILQGPARFPEKLEELR